MSVRRSISSIFIVASLASPALAQGPPTRVGACVKTSIKSIGTRLSDGATGKPVPGSGSAVNYADGGYGVSYSTIPAIERSRRGDPIHLCLIRIPTGCPKGDDRGKEYKATNLRTRRSWTLPDSEHSCGGA